MIAAGPFMILVVLFDAGWFVSEVWSHRILLGEDVHKIPWQVYVRAQLLTYVFMVLVPAGRAGAEVARAAALKKHVGGAKVAAAATTAQAISLLANTLISIPCAFVIAHAVGPEHPLTWLMILNGIVTGVIGGVIIVVSRRLRLGRFLTARTKSASARAEPEGRTQSKSPLAILRIAGSALGKRVQKLVHVADAFDDAVRIPRRRLFAAIGVNFLGRISQTVQYGIALVAVGGALSGYGALLAQGVHLVGAFAGDFIPNQVGVVEGTYRLFAGALGFGDDPAKSVSIALLARVDQILLASISLALLAAWGGTSKLRAEAREALRGEAETASDAESSPEGSDRRIGVERQPA
jgi:hypothetical protein